MSINNKRKIKDMDFDEDFEVIYDGPLPDIDYYDDEEDDYEEVVSNLQILDEEDGYFDTYEEEADEAPRKSAPKKQKKGRKKHKLPNLASPTVKAAKSGTKAVFKILNLLLRGASLVLTAAIIFRLADAFLKNTGTYGNLFNAYVDHNYTLAAYAGVALFLLLIEIFTFFVILFAQKKSGRGGRSVDTGRGLFSFIFILVGSYASFWFHGLIPASPAPLTGVQGALQVFGDLHGVLLPLCAAGIISCLVRRFIIR